MSADPRSIRRERLYALFTIIFSSALAAIGARYGITIPAPQLPPVQVVPISPEEFQKLQDKQQDKHFQELRGARELSPLVEVPDYCMKLRYGNHLCSATCVASTETVSLCITASHCYEHRAGVRCELQCRNGKEWYTGEVFAVSESADVALVVVPRKLPSVKVSAKQLRIGDPVEHFGITSGHTKGKVTYVGHTARGSHSLRTTLSSIPGDSGAGILSGGEYVGTNWGRWLDSGEQGGTSVRYLHALVSSSGFATRYHSLAQQLPDIENLPQVPPSAVPECPGGVCSPPRRSGPIRRLFGRW